MDLAMGRSLSSGAATSNNDAAVVGFAVVVDTAFVFVVVLLASGGGGSGIASLASERIFVFGADKLAQNAAQRIANLHQTLGRDGDAITLSVSILLRRLGYLQEATAPVLPQVDEVTAFAARFSGSDVNDGAFQRRRSRCGSGGGAVGRCRNRGVGVGLSRRRCWRWSRLVSGGGRSDK